MSAMLFDRRSIWFPRIPSPIAPCRNPGSVLNSFGPTLAMLLRAVEFNGRYRIKRLGIQSAFSGGPAQ